MKRLLAAIILTIPSFAFSAQVADRDVLLTPEGVLYTVESQNNDGSAPQSVNQFLRVTVQRGNDVVSTVVPDSLTPGFHRRPALAFDSKSNTLFVFWIRMPNGMSSELLIAAYHDGKWDPALSIDNKSFRLRSNLRIAVRHQIAQPQADGSYRDIPGLVIHTVWWEQTGDGEMARYALVGVDKGSVGTVELHDLSEFVPSPQAAVVDPGFNQELLKHSAIIDTMSPDSVDVVFGDLRTNSLNRVTLRPIADGRIHIPIGRDGGGTQIGVPKSFSAEWSGKVSAVVPGHDDGTLLLYEVSETTVNFLLYSNGSWSSVKSVPLNEKLSSDAAIAALTRMLNQ